MKETDVMLRLVQTWINRYFYNHFEIADRNLPKETE